MCEKFPNNFCVDSVEPEINWKWNNHQRSWVIRTSEKREWTKWENNRCYISRAISTIIDKIEQFNWNEQTSDENIFQLNMIFSHMHHSELFADKRIVFWEILPCSLSIQVLQVFTLLSSVHRLAYRILHKTGTRTFQVFNGNVSTESE